MGNVQKFSEKEVIQWMIDQSPGDHTFRSSVKKMAMAWGWNTTAVSNLVRELEYEGRLSRRFDGCGGTIHTVQPLKLVDWVENRDGRSSSSSGVLARLPKAKSPGTTRGSVRKGRKNSAPFDFSKLPKLQAPLDAGTFTALSRAFEKIMAARNIPEGSPLDVKIDVLERAEMLLFQTECARRAEDPTPSGARLLRDWPG